MQSNSRIVVIIAAFKMNANEIVSVLKGKTDKVKTKLSSDPRKSVTAGFVGLGFAGLGYSVISDNHNSIDNSLASFIRALSFNSNEIISHSLNNFQTVYDSVKDSGASLSMISEDGLSGLKTSLGLACAGVVKAVDPPVDGNIKKETNPVYPDIDDHESETHKSSKGKAVVYLGLATIGLGLVGVYYLTDSNFSLNGANSEVQSINAEEVTSSNTIYQNTEKPPVDDITAKDVSTTSTTETSTDDVTSETNVEPITEPVETPWYAHMKNAEVGTYSTLLGDDVYAVKNVVLDGSSYDLFDIQTEQHILTHQEFTPSNLRLDLELSSDQYRDLTELYGTMISATMETIDLDGAGMDKVAVHYVGTGGDEGKVLDFEMDYIKNQDVVSYLYLHLTGR